MYTRTVRGCCPLILSPAEGLGDGGLFGLNNILFWRSVFSLKTMLCIFYFRILNPLSGGGLGDLLFLPTPTSVVAWVFIWQVSPLPPLPHLQFFVSLRYRMFLLGTENAMGGRGSLAVYAILFKHCLIFFNVSMFQFFGIQYPHFQNFRYILSF